MEKSKVEIPAFDVVISPQDCQMLPGMVKMRTNICALMRKMESYPEGPFQYFIRKNNPYDKLRYELIMSKKAQFVSKGWLKCYEMLSEFQIPPPQSVVCNAELPGGFLLAINHYYDPRQFSFKFTSWLEGFGDDYGIVAGNPAEFLPNEYPEYRGDTTSPEYLRAIKASGLQADLYTADGGLDVADAYDNQEEKTIMLNFGQILFGLTVLRPGGTMITKMYTFFTPASCSIIAILSQLFESVHICKPLTSNDINREIYLVSRNYRGIPGYIEEMYDMLPKITPNTSLIAVPNNVFIQMQEVFILRQTKALNLLYRNWHNNKKTLDDFYAKLDHSQAMTEWLSNHPVKTLTMPINTIKSKR